MQINDQKIIFNLIDYEEFLEGTKPQPKMALGLCRDRRFLYVTKKKKHEILIINIVKDKFHRSNLLCFKNTRKNDPLP